MAQDLTIRVNEEDWQISASPDTPLLYVLMNELELTGPRFGCGLAQCGSCSILVDGVEIRSCVTPVSQVVGKAITTLEGLPNWYAKENGQAGNGEGVSEALHPLQRAFIDVQAVQCGACYNGMTIKGAELLSQNPKPSEVEIRQAMNGHLCRCGTYAQIHGAIHRAAGISET